MPTGASIFAKLILDATEYTKGLNKSKTDTNTFTKQGKSALGGLGTAFQSVTGFSLGTAGAISVAVMAVKKISDYTKQAIAINDQYVSSIVDMARFTGDNTDAMSRMVQVADDAFLSQTDLNTAMSIGAKKGLDMSVQGIQNLADQYNALATPQERAKLLNDNFGRSGLEMGKLLELGSEGIRTNMSAIQEWMVVTEDTVGTVVAYKQSLDAAQDANDGMAYSVANATMPAVTNVNNAYANMIDSLNKSNVVQDELSKGAWYLEGALTGLKVIFGGYNNEVDNSTAAIDRNTQATLNNAAAQYILAGTSRGSIYDETYSTPGTSRGSIYATPHALGGTTIAGSTSMVNERGIPEMVSVGNKDYLTMGSQNGTVTPLIDSGSNNTDTMMVSALMSVIASNQALPRKIAHEIKQLEKYG